MIAERFPGIAALPVEEKRQLLAELCDEIDGTSAETPDPKIVKILEKRWAAYEKDPSTAITLEEFRKRIGQD